MKNIYKNFNRFMFLLVVALTVPGLSFAANNDCENADYISPTLALCSTHVYNVGGVENPKTDAEKQSMQNVIALKTTVMTQQMYKQYEYLESMIKRFKTQLEKAVLTTKLAASGAGADGVNNSSYSGMSTDGSSFRSNDRYVTLENARNCYDETVKLSAYECLQSNVSAVLSALNDNKTSEAKRQLSTDIEVAKQWGVTNINNCNSLNSPTGLRNCAYGMRVALSNATDSYNRDNRTMNNNSKF